jgi:hypothetical protein
MPRLPHHDDLERTAGDDWTINCAVLDDDGTALDLSTADNVQWMLLGSDGLPAIPELSATVVTIVDPPTSGLVSVTVPHDVTGTLSPGRYPDALRVILAGMRTVVFTGIISVSANPFAVIDAPHPLQLAAP